MGSASHAEGLVQLGGLFSTLRVETRDCSTQPDFEEKGTPHAFPDHRQKPMRLDPVRTQQSTLSYSLESSGISRVALANVGPRQPFRARL